MSKTTTFPTTTNAQRVENAYLRELAAEAGVALSPRQVSKFRNGHGDLYRAHLARIERRKQAAHRVHARQLAEA